MSGRTMLPASALSVVGARGFRDLGGFPTADGRRTRFGRVFRSNGLCELTPADVNILRYQLRLATVLDLRSSDEVRRDGRGPLAFEPVRYVNIPLLREVDDYWRHDIATGLVGRYLAFLESASANVVEALQTIADRDAQPIVFHCSAGKDRTGVIAALLLRCLGVDREAVVGDYAASQLDAEMLAFLSRRPSYATRLNELPDSEFDAQPATMRQFLRAVNDGYGGARQWAENAGIDEATLRRLHDTLLEPIPGEDPAHLERDA